MNLITINPFTEGKLSEYNMLDTMELEDKLELTYKSFKEWKTRPFSEKTKLMLNLAQLLRNKKEELAKLMATEMGKPFNQGVAEAEKCAWVCEYYAKNAEEFLKDELIKTEFQTSFVSFQPIGPILAIMPWNFPFWQVFRFAAPNIMAGNTALLKHSPNTMGCAFEIEKLFIEAGFPENVFTNLCIDIKYVENVIKSDYTAAVTFTGSTTAGSIVAKQAGNYLKKCVVELGGSDAYVVFGDADLTKTIDSCVIAKMINNGQSCIAGKRFIAVDSIAEEFENLFVERMKQFKTGNPLDKSVTCGPMARKDLQLNLHRQVMDSVRKGAKILLGGEFPEQKGFFYVPTVITNIKSGMMAAEEEVFGPVAAIFKVKNEEEAIKVANDTQFGLGAAIFSSDIEKAKRIAKYELNAGSVFINSFVRSDPRLPFGGIKNSGFGRELSEFGIKEFVNIKTICG